MVSWYTYCHRGTSWTGRWDCQRTRTPWRSWTGRSRDQSYPDWRSVSMTASCLLLALLPGSSGKNHTSIVGEQLTFRTCTASSPVHPAPIVGRAARGTWSVPQYVEMSASHTLCTPWPCLLSPYDMSQCHQIAQLRLLYWLWVWIMSTYCSIHLVIEGWGHDACARVGLWY